MTPADTARQAKKNVVAAIKRVARRLGNTPAVCRKCYVHPAVFDAYLDGRLAAALEPRSGEAAKGSHELTLEEEAVVLLIRGGGERAARDAAALGVAGADTRALTPARRSARGRWNRARGADRGSGPRGS